MHPARRLWISIEALHDVVYFDPRVREAGVDLGLHGFWMTYFAFRAAPLGPVGPEVVVATFAGFHPDRVVKSIPEAWIRTTPEACLETRGQVCAEALRAAEVEEAACARAVEILGPIATAADPTGRPLYAANAAVPRSDDPVAALWQITTTLREHRGDGHVAALTAAGLSGLDANVLQVASGRFPAEGMQQARGWSPEEWDAAAARLGTPDPDPLLDVEHRTDEAAWTGGLAPLGEEGVDEVIDLLAPSVAAVRASGVLPDFNPTGLPDAI